MTHAGVTQLVRINSRKAVTFIVAGIVGMIFTLAANAADATATNEDMVQLFQLQKSLGVCFRKNAWGTTEQLRLSDRISRVIERAKATSDQKFEAIAAADAWVAEHNGKIDCIGFRANFDDVMNELESHGDLVSPPNSLADDEVAMLSSFIGMANQCVEAGFLDPDETEVILEKIRDRLRLVSAKQKESANVIARLSQMGHEPDYDRCVRSKMLIAIMLQRN
ncbi:hypothetical protein RLEG12_18715 [Rhizobium leguminosarum bv. trifolii CB782]|nr:hypothetical protein RLEG12_18715 [Rhizobium leguminosarum bv. trifolii CB782]